MLMRVRGLLVGLLGVCAVLALGVGPAWGALSYPFDGSLAPAGGSFGSLGPGSVVVDDSNGHTYVADSASGVVDVFETSSGAPLGKLTGAPGSFGGGRVEVAANNGTGDVYVLDSTDSVVDVFEANGAYHCQITGSSTPSASECNGVAGSDTPAHGFSTPGGITVDQATGDVYVVDANNGAVDIFSVAGAYVGQVSLGSIPGGFEAVYTRGVAVDDSNGHVYVADSGPEVVYVFNALGEYETTWTGTPAGHFRGFVSVAADNSTGDVFVTESSPGVVDVFAPSGAYDARFGQSPTVLGAAVGQASGRVYLSSQGNGIVEIYGPAVLVPDVATGAASNVQPRSATLNGSVNPAGVPVSDCHFDYGTSAAYGQSAPCAETVGSGTSVVPVHADIALLSPGTTYHFRLVSANANGTSDGADATLSTPPPPAIDSVSATNVTGASADLNARIDPNGLDTTYRFEWGTSTAYGTSVPVPDADIGAGVAAVPVSTHLSGLSTSTTYHWRVVAQNASGTTITGDHTFVYTIPGVGLPDGRAYEMVTPPRKNGMLIGRTVSTFEPDVSEGGGRVVLVGIQCFDGAGACNAAKTTGLEGDPLAFTRVGGGWVTTPLAPPATRFGASSPVAVSADAGSALFAVQSSPTGGDVWYARQPDGSFVGVGPVSLPSAGALRGLSVMPAAATADLSHVVWSIAAGSGGLWPFDATTGEGHSLYEYVGAGSAAPVLVGVSGGVGSTDLIGECGTNTGYTESGQAPGSLSADGRVLFFAVERCSSGSGVNAGVPVPAKELFARIDGSRSVLISGRSQAGCTSVACLGSPAGDAQFQGASVDGSKAFFQSTQQLTDTASEDSQSGDTAHGGGCSATTGVNGCNLYEYDFGNPAGRGLVAVSAGDSSGGGPRVQGVMAVSSDGSHVYFVARGVLSSGANGGGGVARDGAENLYVFERDAAHPEGRVAFIATLPESDSENWTGTFKGPANVTPDGRFLVFTSHGALTTDDTSLSGAAQVFRYDAQTGGLVRVSVGDRGFNDNGNRSAGTPCQLSSSGFCSEDARIVRATAGIRSGAARLDPTMSHDGSYVFFSSPVALTPGALDDVQVGEERPGLPGYAQNVYEYHEGRVFLISDGRDTGQAALQAFDNRHVSDVVLLGSDGSGANVFFTTSDRLVASDTDTEVDVYDARVCTAGDPCIPSSPPVVASCDGEACHGAAGVAPPALAGATVTFSGPGNLAAPLVAPRKAVVKKHVRHRRRRGRPGKRRARGRGAAHHGGRRGGRS
jgi:DNA-binding beta-propeller fold protein YncE